MTDETVLRVLGPAERADRKMTIGGDGRSFSTRAISTEQLGAPYTLDVQYRDGRGAPIQPVGRYALDLAKMLELGLVRLQRQKTGEVVRMIVQERQGEFYIQLNQGGPRLRLP